MNRRPLDPQSSALPNYATSRFRRFRGFALFSYPNVTLTQCMIPNCLSHLTIHDYTTKTVICQGMPGEFCSNSDHSITISFPSFLSIHSKNRFLFIMYRLPILTQGNPGCFASFRIPSGQMPIRSDASCTLMYSGSSIFAPRFPC